MSSHTTNMTLSNPTALILRSSCALVLPLFIGEWGIYTAGIISWFGAAALLAIICNRRLENSLHQ